MKRLPRAYLGRNHQTQGVAVLAVLKAVTVPERILGADLAARLGEVREEKVVPDLAAARGLRDAGGQAR